MGYSCVMLYRYISIPYRYDAAGFPLLILGLEQLVSLLAAFETVGVSDHTESVLPRTPRTMPLVL